MNRLLVAALVGATFAAAQPARADENYFAYSYGSETLPKGKSEAYLWVTDRRGKNLGSYDAQDYKIELEHGFSDRFQASLYMNFTSHHIDGLEPELEDQHRNFGWNGMQASFKYAFTSPYKDGIGVALYVEPGFARYGKKSGERETQLSLETKLLLQKNFLDDKLIWVGNITAEQEFEHEGGDDWESELEFELSSGLAYNVAPGWHLGVEGRYTSAYENFPEEFHRSDYALFVGPTVHYATRKWWATLSYQPQVDGGPNIRSSSRNLADYEKREIRLKLGYNF
jgi:hypothetical protein